MALCYVTCRLWARLVDYILNKYFGFIVYSPYVTLFHQRWSYQLWFLFPYSKKIFITLSKKEFSPLNKTTTVAPHHENYDSLNIHQ